MSFIESVKDGAIQAQIKYGICASMTIAQAILESGWGKHSPSNNLFGIKWQENCGYDYTELPTKEYENGEWITIQDKFRAYESLNDSVYDHAMFLVNNSRYHNLLGVTDYKTACQLIQLDGYATDPNYANTLIQIIEENNLSQYDEIKEVEEMIKDIVVVNNCVDERAGQYLADFLQCACINNSIRQFDFSKYQNVYGVGGGEFTSYVNKVYKGNDRFETMKVVLSACGKL